MTASSSSLLVDQNLVYTITATNNGPSDATGVTVVDTLPATPKDVKFISATGGVTPDGSGNLNFNVGNLASGATVTYTVTVQPTVAAPADSPLGNSATIAGNEHDPRHRQQYVTVLDHRPPGRRSGNRHVQRIARHPRDRPPAHLHGDRHQQRTVTSHGRHPFKPLGQRRQFRLGQRHQGSVGLQGSSVVASLNDLAAGASATVTFVVVPSAFGSLTATVNVTSNETDTNPSNNSGSTTTTVLDRPGTIEFAVSSYVVAENAGSATITVSRVLAHGAPSRLTTRPNDQRDTRPRLHAGFGHSRVPGRCAV